MSRRNAIAPPYFKWRDGRPRWEPGPRLRPHFKGQDLKDEAGRWLPLEAAIAAAKALNAGVAAWKDGGAAPRRKPLNRKPARTCQHLFDLYRVTPEFSLLAESTRRDYENKAQVFLGDFGDAPVASIGRAALKGFWRTLYDARGHHMANGVLAVARAMLTHATDLEWIEINRAFALKLPTPPPRLALWLPKQVAALVETADAVGAPSIGDAVIAALHSGQRQGDVLALALRIFDDQRIRLSQAKMRGKARIDAPMTAALAARVAAIRTRRAKMTNVVDLTSPLITRDGTPQPYTSDAFRKEFARVRAAAVAAGHKDLADLRFQDLRDTAVTRLALADCSLPQIAAITGHELTSITSIVRHYLVLQPAMADTAIAKLSTWLDTNGIAL